MTGSPSHPGGRFIPAYAGNAHVLKSQCVALPVHPRIRGERRQSGTLQFHIVGSSPHTRGTLFSAAHNVPLCRFIPAYAGNARMAPPIVSASAVHPRIRGERAPGRRRARCGYGSSPHTRGTRPGGPHSLPNRRFIPAYAGNAWCRTSTKRAPPVHPRIRGERIRSLVWRF